MEAVPKSLTSRFLLRIGRSVRVRPLRTVAVLLATIGACLAVSLLTEWCDRASILMALKSVASPLPADAGTPAAFSPVVLPVYRDLVRSDAVLLRTLAVVGNPASPGASQWREAREAWEAARSPETWARLEQALRQLDSEIKYRRQDAIEGPALLARLARLSERVSVSEGGSQGSIGFLRVSVSWPVRSGDVHRVAECLAAMACDRLQEVQMKAAREAADYVRLRRETLRPTELAPAEDALKQFVEQELESPLDVEHLEQLSRSSAEADLPIYIKRLRQELLTSDLQRAEAVRLRRLLLESLPASVWNGAPRRDKDGEMTAPEIGSISDARLADDDPVLTQLTLVIPKEALDRNVILGRLKAREAELLLGLHQLRSEFNPGYLGIGDKRTELARVRREILTQVIGEAAQLQVSIAVTSNRSAELQKRLEAAERQFQRLNGKLGRYQQLVHDLDAARKRYLNAWLDETETIKNQEQGLPAVVPQVLDISGDYAGRRAWLASPRMACVVGGVAGLVLALVYALVAGVLDHTLRWPDELERHTGIRVIGRVKKAGDRIVA